MRHTVNCTWPSLDPLVYSHRQHCNPISSESRSRPSPTAPRYLRSYSMTHPTSSSPPSPSSGENRLHLCPSHARLPLSLLPQPPSLSLLLPTPQRLKYVRAQGYQQGTSYVSSQLINAFSSPPSSPRSSSSTNAPSPPVVLPRELRPRAHPAAEDGEGPATSSPSHGSFQYEMQYVRFLGSQG